MLWTWMTQTFEQSVCRSGLNFPKGHAYGHGEFVHCSALWHIALSAHSQWCLPISFAEILAGGLCLSPTWGAYNIGCHGGAHYPSGEGGVVEWFVVVGRQWWQRMSQAFQKLCPMLSTHWRYSLSWTGHRAKGSFMFCVWIEEMSGYYALMWSVSTRLAHGMLEATLDFFIIRTVEVSSLLRIFGIWCFHQSYWMVMCGFHHLMHAQMGNEELWLRDAINMRRWI